MMKGLSTVVDLYSRWIDAVANVFIAVGDRIASRPIVKFVENESGGLIIQMGQDKLLHDPRAEHINIVDEKIDLSAAPKLAAALPRSQVELTLQPRRFLFRPIELPNRAAEFLGGIVRAQIDRLTPWNPQDTAFGWSNPIQNGPDRMAVNLAVTTQNFIRPYIEAIADAGAYSITVFASSTNAAFGDQPIKVWEERSQGSLKLVRMRKVVSGALGCVVVLFGASLGASSIIGANYDAQQQEIEHRISSVSAAAQAAKNSSSAVASAGQDLVKRKNQNLSSVVILNILSRILPEHTYLTELRIEGNKLRLVGVTKDSPSLIALIEQSDYFSHASFFAPTTRSQSDDRERFHIEATIQPLASLRS